MNSASGDEAAAAPAHAAAARRVNPKLLVIAGALALLLTAGAVGLALSLWPKAADPAEAKAARLTARRAAVPASAAASVAAHAEASAIAAARPVAPSAAALEAPPVARPAATSGTPPHAPSPEPAVVAQTAAGEAPLDRLQRRLGEVLGARGAIDPARPGELRVLTRSAQVTPVPHAAATPAAAPRGAVNSVPAPSPAPRAATPRRSAPGGATAAPPVRGPEPN